MKDAIYFIAGVVPTAAEAAEIKKLGIKRIRNASVVKDTDCLEKCSKVAGKVPEKYKGFEVVKVKAAKKAAKTATKVVENDESLG